MQGSVGDFDDVQRHYLLSFSFQGPASAYRPLQKAGESIVKGAERD
nr:MAG TPA: hypothetical protein [Caudoviricetes sp.]